MKPYTFSWAPRWQDPLTRTEVVRLSPDNGQAFVTAYFRINTVTDDGRTMLLAGRDDEGSQLWALDLESGELADLGRFRGGSMGIPVAAARHDRVAHLVVRLDDGREAIERVEIDTGRRERIVPSRDFHQIYDAGCTADGRYVVVPDSDAQPRGLPLQVPGGMTEREYRRHLQFNPPPSAFHAIDLASGETTVAFECDGWNPGHPNPNPTRPELFMCCEETGGRQHADYQRVRVRNLRTNEWLDTRWPFNTGNVSHEIWLRDGSTIYGHSGYLGYQNISRYRLSTGRWETYIVPIGSGDSAHVHPAPNERFLVGDGKNFGWNTEDDAAGKAGEQLDHAFDGAGAHSLGEVIWKFELPRSSLIDESSQYAHRNELVAPIHQNPDKVVRVSPICKFRSRMRLLNKPMRLESNAHVTPDSGWVVFTSCSEAGRPEIWAARVMG